MDRSIIADVEELLASKTTANLNKAVDIVFEHIYFSPHQFGIRVQSDDMRSDFLVWVHPRLVRILTRYNPERGVLFPYIRSFLSLYWKTFRRKLWSQDAVETTVYAETEQNYITQYKQSLKDTTALYACDTAPVYSGNPVLTPQYPLKTAHQKKVHDYGLLLLACKSYFLMNDKMITLIAKNTHWSSETIQKFLLQTRRLNNMRFVRSQHLLEQCTQYYIRNKYIQYQLDREHTDSSRYRTLKKMSDVCKRSLEKKRIQYTQHRIVPSNRLLAKIFALPHQRIARYLERTKTEWYPHQYENIFCINKQT